MDITLVVNPGSSSKKYELYRNGERIFSAHFETKGDAFQKTLTLRSGQSECTTISQEEFSHALRIALEETEKTALITSTDDITRVGVRIVAPGTYFQEHHEIDTYFTNELKKLVGVLPLHILPILEEMSTVASLLPHARHIGVSDSAFHKTLPIHQYEYSLKGTREYNIRRFGYHGLSVQSVLRKLTTHTKDTLPSRVVVAHIGSGVSVTGVRDGESVYTTMGYTPASGLMMSSRCGEIDPGALIEFLHQNNLRGGVAHTHIQKYGGFVGLLGTADLRVALAREAQGDEAATEALRMFLFGIQKGILGAAIELGGIDTLILTATAVERNDELRSRLIRGLSFVGAELDEDVNEVESRSIRCISSQKSKFTILVIPTDEMGEIAALTTHFE